MERPVGSVRERLRRLRHNQRWDDYYRRPARESGASQAAPPPDRPRDGDRWDRWLSPAEHDVSVPWAHVGHVFAPDADTGTTGPRSDAIAVCTPAHTPRIRVDLGDIGVRPRRIRPYRVEFDRAVLFRLRSRAQTRHPPIRRPVPRGRRDRGTCPTGRWRSDGERGAGHRWRQWCHHGCDGCSHSAQPATASVPVLHHPDATVAPHNRVRGREHLCRTGWRTRRDRTLGPPRGSGDRSVVRQTNRG